MRLPVGQQPTKTSRPRPDAPTGSLVAVLTRGNSAVQPHSYRAGRPDPTAAPPAPLPVGASGAGPPGAAGAGASAQRRHLRLAAGFAVATSIARRYVGEAVDLLATLADDVTAATDRRPEKHGLIDALTGNTVATFVDRGNQGAVGTVHTPLKHHSLHAARLSHGQTAVNQAHAHIRSLGERAVATLKG